MGKEIFNSQTISLIKKLNTVFKNGYVASRGGQTYRYFIDDDTTLKVGKLANCFEHACFNLKNEHFESLDITPSEASQTFGRYGGLFNYRLMLDGDHLIDEDEIKDALFSIIKNVGLEYRLCLPSSLTKSNEWKVAFYLADDPESRSGHDFHFLLNEKNNTWSSKEGWSTDKLQIFKDFPGELISSHGLDYKLENVYIITNPFAEAEKE